MNLDDIKAIATDRLADIIGQSSRLMAHVNRICTGWMVSPSSEENVSNGYMLDLSSSTLYLDVSSKPSEQAMALSKAVGELLVHESPERDFVLEQRDAELERFISEKRINDYISSSAAFLAEDVGRSLLFALEVRDDLLKSASIDIGSVGESGGLYGNIFREFQALYLKSDVLYGEAVDKTVSVLGTKYLTNEIDAKTGASLLAEYVESYKLDYEHRLAANRVENGQNDISSMVKDMNIEQYTKHTASLEGSTSRVSKLNPSS